MLKSSDILNIIKNKKKDINRVQKEINNLEELEEYIKNCVPFSEIADNINYEFVKKLIDLYYEQKLNVKTFIINYLSLKKDIRNLERLIDIFLNEDLEELQSLAVDSIILYSNDYEKELLNIIKNIYIDKRVRIREYCAKILSYIKLDSSRDLLKKLANDENEFVKITALSFLNMEEK